MLAHRQSAARRRLRRVLAPFIAEAAALPDVDRYRKRFTTEAHLWTLVLHGLDGMSSLRQSHAQIAAQPELWQAWGLDQWISLSQLARSSTSRPLAPFALLAQRLMDAAGVHADVGGADGTIPEVHVLDSTFLPLSDARSPWAGHGQFAPGLRLQVLLGLPAHQTGAEIVRDLKLTGTETNDHQALADADLTSLSGTTLLVDLGYYGHRNLARLREAGVDVVTPAHPQASTTVIAELPRPVSTWISQNTRLLADQHIHLGSPNNRRGATLSALRQITSQTPNGVQALLTSRFDLEAAEVVALYRRRWRLELFFRWLKHDVGLLPPIGTSPQAVWITVLLAIIVHALLTLLRDLKPPTPSHVAWLRALAMHLRVDLPHPGG